MYRRTITSADGTRKTSPFWYHNLRDHLGRHRRLATGTPKREVARAIVDRVKSVMEDRKLGPVRSVVGLPQGVVRQLADWGVLDKAVTTGIAARVDEWRDDRLRRGDSQKVRAMHSRVMLIVDQLNWRWWADIDGQRASALIQSLTKADGTPHTQATRYAYFTALRAFCRWHCDRTGVAMPLLPKTGSPQATRIRGCLTLDEARALIATTRASGVERHGLDPEQRALVYEVAMSAGLRAKELTSLTPSCVRTGKHPALMLPAEITKNRRDSTVPITQALADKLAGYIAARRIAMDAGLFVVPNQSAAMIRKDMAAAKIPEQRSEHGRTTWRDFHSLRHTFISLVANDPRNTIQTARDLARHHSVTMTERYVHAEDGDSRRAVNALPFVG